MKTLVLGTDNKSIAAAADILRQGGLVAIPTETVYGLAANALNPDAVADIFKAKGRPQDNPLIVHVSCYEEIPPLVKAVDRRLPQLAEAFWPGPLTVIMPKSDAVPAVVSAGLDTVAIRMPSHPVAAAIIRAAGVPLAAPSANSSGKPSPTCAAHVMLDLDGKIPAVVDGGECSIGVESTVISLAGEVPVLLRPGGITPEQLEAVLGKIEISPAVFAALEEGQKVQSPGMKYKHYSPKALVSIVDGTFECYKKLVRLSGGCAAVCFEGEGQFFENSIEYGKENDSFSQARGLFAALREVDAMGSKRAYVRCPGRNGVGLAVYNRLLRAAAFREIDLNKKTPVIGLTGQTGAGKTSLCRLLKVAGLEVIDCDITARKAVENPNVLAALCERFGNDLAPGGVLNRAELARRAFSSADGTAALNAITHPEITRLVLCDIAQAKQCGVRGIVVDAAALLASPLAKECDLIAAVVAPLEARIERIMRRDSITRSAALCRINAQPTEEYYLTKADIIVSNTADRLTLHDAQPLLTAASIFRQAD